MSEVHETYEDERQGDSPGGGSEVLPFRVAVPSSFGDLVRTSGRPPTINDLVDAALEKVWPSSQFQKLISAIYREESVEGSLRSDDQEAARMIREAEPVGSPLKEKPLDAIRHSLRVVLHRYGQSRLDRLRSYDADSQLAVEN